VLLLDERPVDEMPYVSSYLERELLLAELCAAWHPACRLASCLSMGQRVLFQIDDQKAPGSDA
jgi:hypothetical protein